MMKANKLAKRLLNAVYDDQIAEVEKAIQEGANPSWIFNGYPILFHAIYLEHKEIAMLLIRKGALQCEEAMGFALEMGLGDMVLPMAILGIQPKAYHPSSTFGDLPLRFAATSIAH